MGWVCQRYLSESCRKCYDGYRQGHHRRTLPGVLGVDKQRPFDRRNGVDGDSWDAVPFCYRVCKTSTALLRILGPVDCGYVRHWLIASLEVRYVSSIVNRYSQHRWINVQIGLFSDVRRFDHDPFMNVRLAHIIIFFTTITNKPAMTPTIALSTHAGTPFSVVLGGTEVVRVGIC